MPHVPSAARTATQPSAALRCNAAPWRRHSEDESEGESEDEDEGESEDGMAWEPRLPERSDLIL